VTVKQPYFIVEQRTSTSKVYGTPMTEITFIGCRDRKEYRTYVDSGNRNQQHWQHILNNPSHGFIVRNVRLTKKSNRRGIPLINADSQIIIEWEDDTPDEMARQLDEIWAEEDRRNDSDKFSDLFGE
jgi:hypothetical protein